MECFRCKNLVANITDRCTFITASKLDRFMANDLAWAKQPSLLRYECKNIYRIGPW